MHRSSIRLKPPTMLAKIIMLIMMMVMIMLMLMLLKGSYLLRNIMGGKHPQKAMELGSAPYYWY